MIKRNLPLKAALRRSQDTGLVDEECHDRSYARAYLWR
jgi:hypothetical protein